MLLLLSLYYSWSSGGPEGGIIYDFSQKGDIIYAGTSGGVYKSINKGRSWIGSGLKFYNVFSVFAHPFGVDTVLAGTEKGVFISYDGGNSWDFAGIDNKNVYDIIFKLSASVYYAGTDSGVWKSNTGNIWSYLSLGEREVYSIDIDPIFPSWMYAGTDSGIFKSTNSGNSWSLSGLPGIKVFCIRVSRNDPSTIYAGTEYHGCYLSTDGGNTWDQTSLDTGNVYILLLDSLDKDVAFAGTDSGVFFTDDGGNTWIHTGLSRKVIYGLEYLGDSIIAGTKGVGVFIHDLLRWNRSSAGLKPTYTFSIVAPFPQVYAGIKGGVYVSSDTANEWDTTSIYNYMFYSVTSEVRDTIFAGCEDGLFMSPDGGLSWTRVLSGNVKSCKINPHNHSFILAGLSDGTYHSTDGGNTWVKISTHSPSDIEYTSSPDTIYGAENGVLICTDGSGIFSPTPAPVNRPVRKIAVDPADPKIVYAATDTGIYRSFDAGGTWELVLPGVRVLSVEVKRDDGRIVYAGTPFGVLKSINRGKSWSRFNRGELDTDGIFDLLFKDGFLFAGTRTGVYVLQEDTLPPTAPSLLSPPDNAWMNDSIVYFDWSNSTDDAAGLLCYLLRIDTSNTLYLLDTLYTSEATEKLEEGIYSWRVFAVDSSYNTSSAARRFFGVDFTPPYGASATSPPYSTGLSFTVSWSRGNDNLSGVVSYDVLVSINGGPWNTWLTDYTDTSATYNGTDGYTYAFEALAKDRAGNREEATGIPETETKVDTTHPQVSSTNPADGDTNVAINSSILITFSEAMNPSTIIDSYFTVTGDINGSYAFSLSYDTASYTATLEIDGEFAEYETVNVKVDTLVEDEAGNRMHRIYEFLFVTGGVKDSSPPTVSSANATPNPCEPVNFVVITAYASDVDSGNSNIAGAEYFIDGIGADGTGIPMTAKDGYFDEPSEDIIDTLDTYPLSWKPGETHSIYIHALDASGNWGGFDTVIVSVSQDDDTIPPDFLSFSPDTVPDTLSFYIRCRIEDISGVYDDNTGSDGQGVYLLWDNDGEIEMDANEVQLDSSGSYFYTVSPIPPQSPGVDFVYRVYAWDNDFDTYHPLDRSKGESPLMKIVVIDVRAPEIESLSVTPNPTFGETLLYIYFVVSDSGLGNSTISGAEYFIDVRGPDSTGNLLNPADGLFDSYREEFVDTLNISGWELGSYHTLYFHGMDSYGNWGTLESVVVEVKAAPDTIPPYVTGTKPADGDTNVPLNSNISIFFSEPLDTSTIKEGAFELRGTASGLFTFSLTYDTSLYQVLMDPSSDFSPGETLHVSVSTQLQDTAGNSLESPYSFQFVAASSRDTILPVVDTLYAYPNPTEGARKIYVEVVLEDTSSIASGIGGGEIFIDTIKGNGDGISLLPEDGAFDENVETSYVYLDGTTLPLGDHSIYAHGLDLSGNWGDFDSIILSVTPDDDTLPPEFSGFSPDTVPDTSSFYISAVITDPSGVYDDETGSQGQGVYLLWDNDGEIEMDANEYTMSRLSGDTFITDYRIPKQNAGADFVYEVYAYDNDFDFGEPEDRMKGSSGILRVFIKDSRGPEVINMGTSPVYPPEGTKDLIVYATISDSGRGNSIISAAFYYVDSMEIAIPLSPVDGVFDSIKENVVDTFDMSQWKAGEEHRIYFQGRDTAGNFGPIDSITVWVSEYVDTFPPEIAYTSPADGEDGVPLNTWIYVTFNEKIDPASLTSDKVMVEGKKSGTHEFWMSYEDTDSTLKINPYEDFAELETVTVYLASGIKDLYGNATETAMYFSFFTQDTTKPFISGEVTPETLWGGGDVILRTELWDNHALSSGEVRIDTLVRELSVVEKIGDTLWKTEDTLSFDSYGEYVLIVRAKDSQGNESRPESLRVMVMEEDTKGPSFTIILPESAYIGEEVEFIAIPDEPLFPDTPVLCEITSRDTSFSLTLEPGDTVKGKAGTAGLYRGPCKLILKGYDRFMNEGISCDTFYLYPALTLLPEDSVWIYPNPAPIPKWRNYAFFSFWINENATVKVEVYDLEGRMIAREERNFPGGKRGEIEWDIEKTGTDIYFVIFEATSLETGEKARVIKKMVVVK